MVSRADLSPYSTAGRGVARRGPEYGASAATGVNAFFADEPEISEPRWTRSATRFSMLPKETVCSWKTHGYVKKTYAILDPSAA